ncbi:MAG: hypothetical protein WA047_02765 [Phenylobacterium sp.]|uniref:hypothetical protein n=1 Tax=Phenylobacterium sp. TaxID=1871053 RepID=UPI003BB54D37
MTATTEKLGLFLPQGLHEQMVQAAAKRLSGRKTSRGGVRMVYEQAFNDLLEALDAGQLVTFPAVRGAKHRISVRVCGLLCARIRGRLDHLNLKLTDFASTAIAGFLHPPEGA